MLRDIPTLAQKMQSLLRKKLIKNIAVLFLLQQKNTFSKYLMTEIGYFYCVNYSWFDERNNEKDADTS